MKRRLRYIMASGVSLMLLLATLATVSPLANEASQNPLHFGVSNMSSNVTLPTALLFEQLFGEKPSANEESYLNCLSGISFVYNDTIPDSVVSTAYNGEEGTLLLSMPPYSYHTANGSVVSWIPVEAELDAQRVPFSKDGEGNYQAVLNGLFHTDDFDVKISLSAEIEIPAESVDALLTQTYQAAEDALAIKQAYEQEYEAWKKENAAFLAYQAYLNVEKEYKQYLEALDYYNQVELPAYEAYLDLLAIQKLYDDWEHFKAYDAYLKTGVEERQKYLAYRAKVDKVIAKLSPLENLFVTDSNNWQLYASLMGNTVTEVIAQKEKLMAAGVLPDVIDAAGNATEKLRVLMKGYADLRNAEYESEHDKLTALYAYYSKNYTEIRDEFAKLYGALHTLHDNSFVVLELDRRGKLEHYRQFVGVLYVTRTALDDSFTRDPEWLIGKRKLTAVVEQVNLVADNNQADPSGVSMPEIEVSKVDEVTPIEKPTQPQPQTRPNPDFMAEPTKPTVVADPNADPSSIPPYAESAGNPPSEPEMDPTLSALAEELRAGTLPKRQPIGKSMPLTLEATMNCPISINNEMTVTFYAADGKTVLDRQKLEYGSVITYNGPDPIREPDAQYIYTFDDTWVFSDGTTPEKMVLTQNMSLYPHYITTTRFYNVTWVLDGEIRSNSLAYGELPRCPFVTERENDEYYTYEFSGWDQEIKPVTEDVTYTGEIKKTPKLYTITWQMGENCVTDTLPYGAQPTPPTDTSRAPDSYVYEFLSWSPAIGSVKGDVTYFAEYKKTPLAADADGQVIPIVHTEDSLILSASTEAVDIRDAALFAKQAGKRLQIEWFGLLVTIDHADLPTLIDSVCRRICLIGQDSDAIGEVYSLMLCNSVGFELDMELPMTVQGLSKDHMSLFLYQNDKWERVVEETQIRGGEILRVCRSYAIGIDPTENCYISELAVRAEAGTLVDLRIGCTFGYHVSAARVTRADGGEVEVKDLCFVMPSEDVFIELTVTRIVYRVSFVANGKVIVENEYFLGEDIEFPETPQKEADDNYIYSFSGWSNDLTVAMGDELSLLFEAQFSATERNQKDPFLSEKNNNWVATIALPIFGGVVVIGVGLLIFFKLRKKKRLLATPADSELPAASVIEAEIVADDVEEKETDESEKLEEDTDSSAEQ